MFVIFRLLDFYSLIIIASAILSWFPAASRNPVAALIRDLTEPVYAQIHKVLNPSMTGGIDLSPIIVLFLISMVKQLLL